MSIVPGFTTNDLAISIAMEQEQMTDTCVRLAWTQLRNADNQEMGADWLPADPPQVFRCFYLEGGSAEGATNVVITTPILFLPLAAAAVFTSRDRVQITHRYGAALADPMEFGIDGDPIVGRTSVSLSLKGAHT